MKTRTRQRPTETIDIEQNTILQGESSLDLEHLTDEELEALLFDEEEESSKGIWNLPTAAGLSMILVGVVYLLQELGMSIGPDLTNLVMMLPILAGILIILLGFGVLSWRPKKKAKTRVKVKKGVEVPSMEKRTVIEKDLATGKKKKRLVKTRDKKIAGVCGGLADYFNLDPTLVRIAFVIGLIASGGPFFVVYLALAFVMPDPPKPTLEERITIIRDS